MKPLLLANLASSRIANRRPDPGLRFVPNPEAGAGPDQLRSLLSSLSKSIYAFVENPLFESAKVVDARLSQQAGRDLQQIIALSKQIKKTSQSLRNE